ncbi:hypothetical protein KC845_00745 [Candidatus Kaiserbacteria bacterium]|nr:hypothetical protein [Candidatus Kaiserbacteria bacterium]
MFWKHKSHKDITGGVVIDIGSGSVGVALVVYDALNDDLKIIWTHREHVLTRNISNLKEAERAVQTALVNVFLELGNQGLRTLSEVYKNQTIDYIQASISAPWQYTNAKKIHYTDDQEFVVDKKLIEDLTKLAEQDALNTISENGSFKDFNITLTGQESIGVSLNGYLLESYLKKKASEISFVHLTTLATESIIDTLKDSHQRIAPNAVLDIEPFMTIFYKVIMSLYPSTLECCLVDITNEATEIGIVRNGTLQHINHIPIGVSTLTQKIATSLFIPTEEAYTYLKANTEYALASVGSAKQTLISEIYDSYTTELVNLFRETGDTLSIPQSVFMHTDLQTESVLRMLLKTATHVVTTTNHNVYTVTSDLISDSHTGDTPILLGVNYLEQKFRDAQ